MPEAMKNKVCRLRKYLYELNQSPRAWFHRFTNVLTNNGYSCASLITPCLLKILMERLQCSLFMWMTLYTGNHVWGNLVTCKSKKQPGVARTSA